MLDLPKSRMRHLLAIAIRDLWKKETGSLTSMSVEGTICITTHGGNTTIIQISNQFIGSIPDGSDDFCEYTQSAYITSSTPASFVHAKLGPCAPPPMQSPPEMLPVMMDRRSPLIDVESPHVTSISDLSLSADKHTLQFNSPSGICIDKVLCLPKNKAKRRTKVCPQKFSDAIFQQNITTPAAAMIFSSLPEQTLKAPMEAGFKHSPIAMTTSDIVVDDNNNNNDSESAMVDVEKEDSDSDDHNMVIDEQVLEDDNNNNNNEQENLNKNTTITPPYKEDRSSPDLALSTPQSYTTQVQNVIKVPVKLPVKDVLRQRLISSAEENKAYIPPLTIIGQQGWPRQIATNLTTTCGPAPGTPGAPSTPTPGPPASAQNTPSFVNSVIAQRQAIGDYATALIQNSVTQKDRSPVVYNMSAQKTATAAAFIHKNRVKRRKMSICTPVSSQPINMTISTYESTPTPSAEVGVNLSQERLYKCEFCIKTFMFKSKYNEHLPVHTDARPFQCDRCSRTYKYKYDLRVHLRTHLGIPTKSTQCPFCGGVFKSNKLLRCHIRLQHKHCDLDMAEIGGFGSEIKSSNDSQTSTPTLTKVLPTYEQSAAKKMMMTPTGMKGDFEQSCFPEVNNYAEVKSNEIIKVTPFIKSEPKLMPNLPIRIEQSCFPEVSKIVEAPSLMIKECKKTELSVSH